MLKPSRQLCLLRSSARLLRSIHVYEMPYEIQYVHIIEMIDGLYLHR